MTGRVLLICAALWAGAPALAQGTIRTGEHGPFTRIVVPVGADRDYTLTAAADSVRVAFSPTAQFDTTAAFDLIDRRRIARLDGSDGLTIDLNCACVVRTFRYEDQFLVIDVAEPPLIDASVRPLPRPGPDPAPPPIAALSPDTPAIPAWSPSAPLRRDLLVGASPLVPRLAPLGGDPPPELADWLDGRDTDPAMEAPGMDQMEPEIADDGASASDGDGDVDGSMDLADRDALAPPSMADDAADPVDTSPPAPTGAVPAAAVDIDDVAAALVEQLARATAAGLLSPERAPDPTAPDPEPDPDPEPNPAPAETPPSPAALPPPTQDDGLPVRAATAVDLALDDLGALTDATALSCSPPIGDLSDWAAGDSFETGLGPLRAAVFDATGALVRDATIALSRHYVAHGFGAEAAHWLTQLTDPPVNELALARYLDGRPGPNFPPVRTLALCTGTDLVWRFIDDPDFPELIDRQLQDMQRAFAAMPIHIRRQIGPDFVRRLVDAGYDDTAADVRAALARGPTLDPQEALLLQLETDDTLPPPDPDRLAAILPDAGPERPRLLREYLAASRAHGEAPNPGWLLAAEALLRETPPDPTFGGLWHEVALALAATGEGLRLADHLSALNAAPPAERQRLLDTIAETLLSADQSAALVIFAVEVAEAPTLSADVQSAVAEALWQLGLADLAQAFGPAPQDAAAPEEALAEPLAELPTAPPAPDTPQPDALRAQLDDSRALRAAVADLLGAAESN